MKSVAPGRMSGAMPIHPSASGNSDISPHSSAPKARASQSAWRNSGAISCRRPAPSRWEIDGGSAISVPIGIIIGSQNIAVPTDTAASVAVPWRPATRLSTSPIIPVATCPAASGAARRAVRASSWRIEGRETGFAEALMRVRLRAGMAPTGNGPLSYVGQQDPR